MRAVALRAALQAAILAGAALAAPPAVLAQGALDTTSLAKCLDGTGIQWRLPYYPRLILKRCKMDERSAKAPIANAPDRRVTAAMAFSSEGFPQPAGERRRYGDAPEALYVHLDRLLAAQGFSRVVGPAISTRGDAYPESAAFERTQGPVTLRVEFATRSFHAFELVVESRGQLEEAARLPVPKAEFDLMATGVSGSLFALPGTSQVSEGLVWEEQDFPDAAQSRGTSKVYVPAREFKYMFASPVAASDAMSAWQVALKQAGWTPAASATWSRSTKAFHFKLPGRVLEVGLSAWEDQGKTQVTAIVMDPAFWQSVVPALRQMEWAKPWEFSPELDVAGKPSEATRRQLFALSGWTLNGGPERLYVVPLVAERLAADKAAAERARKAAQWMRDEILRVGVFAGHNQGLKSLDIHPEVRTASPKSGVEAGARVTYLYCRTVTESRPSGETKSCSCQFDQETLSTRPGACTQ